MQQLTQWGGVSVLMARTSKGISVIQDIPSLYMHKVESKSTIQVLKGYTEKRKLKIIKEELTASREFEYKYKQFGYIKMTLLYPCPTLYDLVKNSIMFRIKKYIKK